MLKLGYTGKIYGRIWNHKVREPCVKRHTHMLPTQGSRMQMQHARACTHPEKVRFGTCWHDVYPACLLAWAVRGWEQVGPVTILHTP